MKQSFGRNGEYKQMKIKGVVDEVLVGLRGKKVAVKWLTSGQLGLQLKLQLRLIEDIRCHSLWQNNDVWKVSPSLKNDVLLSIVKDVSPREESLTRKGILEKLKNL